MKFPPARSNPASRPDSLMIAVADDMPDLCAVLREWLTAEGHVVACAANGAELCALARAHRFDLIVTDVMMPERDGFEVISELRRQTPDVRIIAISGGGATMLGSDCLRVARRLGADAVLSKPFHRAQLVLLINKLMAGKSPPAPQGQCVAAR